ncbi:pseudouridine synthase [Ruminococcus sp. Marseille-P6503]|uniref:pseudouridine synthase n=1 Tax=Ruminococcus sp. Marseille-P6503 TaxID=2364796 RepID=UPI000F54AB47|nr:pseudouridine synthase [Ruminococcus sp. Marseille-P6503]
MEKIRLQKIIAESGYCSRRKAEELIAQGRVQVNGRPCGLGDKALPGKDIIAVDGESIAFTKKKRMYYIMLHKPRGYVTTMKDELDRKCVTDLIDGIPARVYPIGRLDKNSEGLLLFTNDGKFANDIMHPSCHISKTYRVTVRPDINDDQLTALSEGVEIDSGKTRPCTVLVLDKQPGRVVLQMTIHEGKKRQIRKMCEAVGLEVARLKRTSVGPLKLGMLKPGEYRELKPDELRALRNALAKNK